MDLTVPTDCVAMRESTDVILSSAKHFIFLDHDDSEIRRRAAERHHEKSVSGMAANRRMQGDSEIFRPMDTAGVHCLEESFSLLHR
jgi:hypothetical protein